MISRLFENIPKEEGRKERNGDKEEKLQGFVIALKEQIEIQRNFETGKRDEKGRKLFSKR